MQINEICKQTGLTKKAIEYYQSKGLISPEVKDNGYREFTDEDFQKLKTIGLLRKLDFTTNEIGKVLESDDKKSTLKMIKEIKLNSATAKLARVDLIDKVINGGKIQDIRDEISILDKQATIKEKLLMAFPGYYGRYVSFHFGQFLNEAIKTEEQNINYAIVVDFLDHIEPIEIPKELQSFLNEADHYMDHEVFEKMSANMQEAYEDFETYWENNRETMIKYAEYKKSEEYQDSVAAKLLDLFRKFGETNDYYDIFIPAIRKLSLQYDNYYKNMLSANEKLIQKIPGIEKLV